MPSSCDCGAARTGRGWGTGSSALAVRLRRCAPRGGRWSRAMRSLRAGGGTRGGASIALSPTQRLRRAPHACAARRVGRQHVGSRKHSAHPEVALADVEVRERCAGAGQVQRVHHPVVQHQLLQPPANAAQGTRTHAMSNTARLVPGRQPAACSLAAPLLATPCRIHSRVQGSVEGRERVTNVKLHVRVRQVQVRQLQTQAPRQAGHAVEGRGQCLDGPGPLRSERQLRKAPGG